MTHRPLILASTSPTRQALLRNAGVGFEAMRPGVDETALIASHPSWHPSEVAGHLAETKALALTKAHPGSLIIGADQTLLLDGILISAPENRMAARTMLIRLRGRRHTLQSALACARDGGIVFSQVEEAHLTMRDFSDTFLDRYLESAGSAAILSAGGYRLEEQGLQLFERIEGDYFTILGLPLLPLLSYLRQEGLVVA